MASICECPKTHFDVTNLCKSIDCTEHEVCVEVDPCKLYPAMRDHITEVLKSGKLPPEVAVTNNPEIAPAVSARRYVTEAKRITKALADVGKSAKDVDESEWDDRADALELCRRWFTRALSARVEDGGLTVRILKTDGSEKFALHPGFREKPLVS